MPHKLILFLLLAFPAAVFAQRHTAADSLYVYGQTANSLSFAQMSGTLLQSSEIQKASKVGLIYQHAAGSFRLGQEAQHTGSGKFYTEGISTIKRFKLFGFFGFERINDDSLAFNMKGIKESPQPTYFMAGKAGNYQRQRFTGGGIISYALAKEKLFLSTGVDYLYNSTAGSVDPRALVYTFKLKFSPELSYRIANTTVGIGGLLGYGDEDIKQIRYKNSNYDGSLTYPLRISYLNYGYGYYQSSVSPFVRANVFTGLNLSFSKHGDILDWKARVAYEINEEKNSYDLTNGIQNKEISSFQLESLGMNLLVTKKSFGLIHQLKINMLRENGDDRLVAQAARNYTYKNYSGGLSYSILNTAHSKSQGEWNAGVAYRYGYIRDAASSHLLEYTTYEPQIGHSQYWRNAKQDLISAGLSFSARLPANTNVSVPITQVTLFSQGVVFPDYLYWSTKAFKTNLKLNYVSERIINKFRTGLGLETSFLKPLNTLTNTNNATFIPENGFFDVKVSLNLYL
ncbi:MAG: hypothetical protein EOO88_38505 [Pedobacter sp.]|nr:MAG: hypothetical protein EOO88_38505 [Pedobacter sp.]